ncbi:hypothetical protein NUH88_19340 [Nisaea acidiphila]|uniref:Secreted protein n=1 Tax=Nisaea acidiphila TaxID=1862145 RepID=A0A9J7AT82_9PROT|nr:hypothetical protein [Nisaea acidiphila]UUX49540.1 hypothetical protein NUH88_19340 [Nisaea acidiphila]
MGKVFGFLALFTMFLGGLAGLSPAKADDTLMVVCAQQGGTCTAPTSGTKIFYGYNGAVVTTTNTTEVRCNNETFGRDPLSGETAKFCWYYVDPSKGSWATCADKQGKKCNFTGAKLVRYGVPGRWVYGAFINNVTCSNGTFKDPAHGDTKKYCEAFTPS